ncbi:hypothetical protein TPHA_0G00830 [Tetrapisispora phaffii CBS 4417]|uniref:Bacterial surface antigen (D15) domain-containing protein n=1 Tax=Tetrapisispora phaffii (strain ATCC 24235 / CBS 4417 / NBRC 1672 / NRRL Y-8282 / UCD 70-5) TaxID=1071381 RepID=G8BVJ1_TETPH|nr:hypothetical protein TPHA_0G00830 [Tetrapisispora phaffii CBS 4417]CCE63919.1 hypothetical protein TPHA_0G00830 [Tetrapisispora phaffii CBS 4417]
MSSGETVKNDLNDLLMNENKKRIEKLFENNSATPIKISSIVVHNSEHVRSEILKLYLDATLSNAFTFKELCESADDLAKKLIQHGLVENISNTFDTQGISRHNLIASTYPSTLYDSSNIPTKVSVIDITSKIKLIPLKKFMAKTGTNIGNGEGDGYLQFQLRNIFGGGERLNLDITKGTKTHSSYLLNYTQPVNPTWIWDTILYQNNRQLGSSIDMIVGGLRSSIKGKTGIHDYVNHEFYIEGLLRETKIISSNCSNTLLFQAGNDQKVSIGHSIAWDTRDNHIIPTYGSFLKVFNEVALNRYLKSQIEVNTAMSFLKNSLITVNGTMRLGYISNISSTLRPLHIGDRFQLGGGNDVRSFQPMGLGPKDIYDSIGGNSYTAYGISVFTALPFKSLMTSNFKIHTFINGGKLINHNSSNGTFTDAVKDLIKENSLSTGVGIIFKHPVARFELNFTLPLITHKSDMVRKGFQYGIGISFL